MLGFGMLEVSIAQSILENYIQEGLASNQQLQGRVLDFDKGILALSEARSLFLPRVSFETDYFLAGGGRTVDFPAGDLLNPIYSTLNQLTESQAFPMLDNQRILLNPNNFYDVRLRTTLPIFQAELLYNKRIQSDLTAVAAFELLIYKRELVKEIKIAYFNYLKTVEAVRIFQRALQLAEESKRINEALFKNEMVNKTIVVRASNEVIRFQNELEAAFQQSANAKVYFNFLLNRNLTEQVIETQQTLPFLETLDDHNSFLQREELQQLYVSATIDKHNIGLTRAYLLPKISAFMDLGSQGFDWEYNNQTRYYFFGLSTRWNVFAGGQNRIQVQKARIDHAKTSLVIDQVSEQLKMALIISQNNFKASYSQYLGNVSQAQSAKRAYEDSMKLYAVGQILFIELLDAQNQLITAQLQENISLFECHIRIAEIERASASFSLNSQEL
ncbi:outer membrane efflux protein [Lunatimonas lonarensis]|uniref:Outer membrane efflux protein n=2 Tax=Lunatimonas lonarensis TaxID=1232681 RepID=R7ZPR3_9BACT|nr:outer membrane efflux protein [Lunatimonas lonarensis]